MPRVTRRRPRSPKPKPVKRRRHDEDTILETVVAHLRREGVLFCHVPNERKGSPAAQARWNRQGREKGVPDLLIWPDPASVHARGFALELKTETGKLSPEQKQWLRDLAARGWETATTYGLDAALSQLRAWGLIRRGPSADADDPDDAALVYGTAQPPRKRWAA